MDLTLTEDQELIRSTAREVLADRTTVGGGFSADLWKEVVELGWTGLAIPEAYGGVGEGFLEGCLLLEEMGVAQAPSPFLHTLVCAATIERHGTAEQRERWLPGIVEGRTIAYADGADVTAGPSGDGHVLDGTARFVPYAHAVDDLLVVAGRNAYLVDRSAPGVTTEPLDVVGPAEQDDVRFSGVVVPPERVLADGPAVAATASAFGAAATCAEMVGGAQRVLDMTVEYAGQREQFGRPIGGFQAVQHHCADMAIDVLTARFIAFEAIWRLTAPGQDPDQVALTVAVAKAWVSDAYQRVCALGHQVHGAIGFTAEHHLHHYLGHAMSSALAFGDGDFHVDRVADGIGLPRS
ncbi:MAG TPA: acyl-CoA dehydrogenase family protein [Pseudonocardia sp.]|uniref:acyl-CoA dehydrogenase family protein n=1 Tax=Pseudonocardia sp. TaxID=60912 RepID=UPI002B4AFE69|nr:acyl-CoA dehydrogenase family protein [Pseudonocardia sp.]HLU55614.1 acyl-CoA dehydrogenase family protein [Pseudonocardia sp.]